jgi:hypothetical protein
LRFFDFLSPASGAGCATFSGFACCSFLFATGGENIDPSSSLSELTTELLSELITEDDLGREEAAAGADTSECENLQLLPLRHPLADAKKAQGAGPPSEAALEKSLYFFTGGVFIVNFWIRSPS